YRPSGAVVAAPTTSLPEWLGGTRNWDYRYVWTRDAAMAVRATTVLGYDREATEFFYFIRDALLRTHDLGVMYTIEGVAVREERAAADLRGYAGSLPVRIGNGARHQLQLGAAGSLIDAAYVYERFDHVLTLRTWRELRRIIEGVAVGWDQPDDGIWE